MQHSRAPAIVASIKLAQNELIADSPNTPEADAIKKKLAMHVISHVAAERKRRGGRATASSGPAPPAHSDKRRFTTDPRMNRDYVSKEDLRTPPPMEDPDLVVTTQTMS